MEVSVTYRDGRPVPNVRVEIDWESGGRSTAYTRSDGVARFEGDGGIFSAIRVADKPVKGRGLLKYKNPVSVIYDY